MSLIAEVYNSDVSIDRIMEVLERFKAYTIVCIEDTRTNLFFLRINEFPKITSVGEDKKVALFRLAKEFLKRGTMF